MLLTCPIDQPGAFVEHLISNTMAVIFLHVCYQIIFFQLLFIEPAIIPIYMYLYTSYYTNCKYIGTFQHYTVNPAMGFSSILGFFLDTLSFYFFSYLLNGTSRIYCFYFNKSQSMYLATLHQSFELNILEHWHAFILYISVLESKQTEWLIMYSSQQYCNVPYLHLYEEVSSSSELVCNAYH